MVACEEEWKTPEVSNNEVQWEATNAACGWEATPPASPTSRINAGAGTWLSPDELVNARVAAWPSLPLDHIEIEVTIEEHSSVGELAREYSVCRLPHDIVC